MEEGLPGGCVMAFVGSLYSRPRIVPMCIRALMEKLDGRISQAELEDRMKALQDRQLRLFTERGDSEHKQKRI